MKKHGFFVAFVFAIYLGCMAGCGKAQTEPADVTPSNTPTVTDTPTPTAPMEFTSEIVILKEPNEKLNHGVKMYYATRDGITYWFENVIGADERELLVEKTEHILSRICPDRSAEREFNIYICTSDQYNGTYIENDTMYTFYTPFADDAYIEKLLLLVYGEFANYGITSSYADYIAAELAGETFTAPEFKWDEANELSILDLNLLCHRTEFVSASEVEYVENISKAFVGNYIEKNGEAALRELIAKSGDPEKVDTFCKVLSDYYRQNGIEYTPSSIMYAFGGVSYNYFVKTKYATIYFEKDWKSNWDAFKKVDYGFFDGFLHKDYVKTKKYYETITDEMRQYQELFAFDNYDNSLKIFYTAKIAGDAYSTINHTIRLDRIYSFAHEYVHSLSLKNTNMLEADNFKQWAIEGFAEYYRCKYNYYGNYIMNIYLRGYAAQLDTYPLKNYVEALGRDMDMNIEQDWIDYYHLGSMHSNAYDPIKRPYYDGSSFIAFLITKYGEKEAIGMLYPEYKLTTDTYNELLAEWKEYVLTNYSKYAVEE